QAPHLGRAASCPWASRGGALMAQAGQGRPRVKSVGTPDPVWAAIRARRVKPRWEGKRVARLAGLGITTVYRCERGGDRAGTSLANTRRAVDALGGQLVAVFPNDEHEVADGL